MFSPLWVDMVWEGVVFFFLALMLRGQLKKCGCRSNEQSHTLLSVTYAILGKHEFS
jgi:hypothetical protein